MKAFIYTGGRIWPSHITEHPRGDDLVISADSGYRNAGLMGEKTAVLVGDFDSLGEGNVPKDIPGSPEIVRLRPEKDFTDTQAAVDIALDRGADELVIIGGLSGRTDQALSNLAILEHLYLQGIRAIITDGCTRARYMRNSSELIGRSQYPYLSIICADEKLKGVSAEGVKYPLKNAVLTRTNQYAISNEIVENCALISVKKGGMWILETRDPD